MKKILSIIFVSILLVSCTEDKTGKMLETCANEKYESVMGVTPTLKLDLKGKLLNTTYYYHHSNCEEDLRDHPKTFKATWDR